MSPDRKPYRLQPMEGNAVRHTPYEEAKNLWDEAFGKFMEEVGKIDEARKAASLKKHGPHHGPYA